MENRGTKLSGIKVLDAAGFTEGPGAATLSVLGDRILGNARALRACQAAFGRTK